MRNMIEISTPQECERYAVHAEQAASVVNYVNSRHMHELETEGSLSHTLPAKHLSEAGTASHPRAGRT